MKKISPKQYAIALFEGTDQLEKSELPQFFDSYIEVLVRNNDFKKISKIIKEFEKYCKEKKGEVDINVFSAVKLNESEKEAIKKKFFSFKNKIINVNNYIDKNILGGVIIKYKDLILDASILNQINSLKKFLME